MAKPEALLNPSDYRNYRNVQAVLVLYVLLGVVTVLFGVGSAFLFGWVGYLGAVLGVLGVAGGVAALLGRRRWAPLVYVIAVFYLLWIPVGPVAAVVLFLGLGRYFASRDAVAAGTSDPPAGQAG